MTRADPADDFRAAVAQLAALADEVAAERSQEEVLEALTDLRVAVTRAYRGRRPRSEFGGARGRILRHLTKHLGEWVGSDEIAAVSGIGEWARRIRELRWEDGYEIEEGRGRYRLLAESPDLARQARFRTVTSIREMKGPVDERVLALLRSLVRTAVTADELDRVARGKTGATVARQIRNRDLLPIETDADAPDLRAGEHRLVSMREADLLHPSQRLFPEDLRRQVFLRDKFTCRTCRRGHPGADAPADEVFYLEVCHLDAAPDAVVELSADRVGRLARLAASCNECMGASAPPWR
ncbi:hypothetical protein AB0B62_01255 [Micromonospora chalcea]|uniref:hypothetical protein n=1 Tax=Micromonospora TaxID=1873 RepID=UPI0033D62DB9